MTSPLSHSVSTRLGALPTSTTKAALAGMVATVAVLLALLTLYAVFFDQGQLLAPVLGASSGTGNYLHEFAHDARHLLGAPCH
jgi:Probable cobalt transporter subunit (CbtB)